MVIAIILVLAAVLIALTVGFWIVKGQPLDWDGFSSRVGIGHGRNMTHPGQPLKKLD